jgi:DNA-binding XRE family transcriptional regulator
MDTGDGRERESDEHPQTTAPAAGGLAAALHAARTKNGLTQEQLAARLGVSQTTVSFWERGLDLPRVEHIIALAVELPTIVQSLPERERELLKRLMRIERQVFHGRCACAGCTCQPGSRGGPPADP